MMAVVVVYTFKMCF